jgi:hypothetical protein
MMQESIIEVERDDETLESELEQKTETIPEQLYLPLGKPKRVRDKPIATAFTIPDDLPPVILSGIAISWTRTAIAVLADIQNATRSKRRSEIKNLPYASLRGMLEVNLIEATRIEPGIGLNRSQLNSKSTFEPEPFAYLANADESKTRKLLRSILDNWMTHYLKQFATREDVSAELMERLEDLWERNEILKLTPFQSQVLPWSWHPQTGTAQADERDRYVYRSVADYAARLIAGHEIFQGLGPMRRIISSSGFSSSVAELITAPILMSEGRFSLLVSLEVVTFPSLHQPLLKIDVSKRRWMAQLNDPEYDSHDISGFVFSDDYRDRAFSFRVQCCQDENDDWRWSLDQDLAAIRSHLCLPMQPLSVQGIASGQVNTESCQFLLTYRNGLRESAGKHGIKVGVPELDKLEAFEKIAELLAPVGLTPFNEYVCIPASHSKDDAASRMINLPTLMGAILESVIADSSIFTPNYVGTLSDHDLKQALLLHFDLSLDQIQSGRESLHSSPKFKSQTDELAALIQLNQSALRRLYPNEPLRLLIFYESHLQTEVKLLQNIIRLLYRESIEVLANRLPDGTHGYKDSLPGSKLKAKDRSQLRRKVWAGYTKQLEACRQRTFCLVLARKFYPDLNQSNKLRLDDRVNKPSTRQALAAMAGSCVQFILPMERTLSKKQLKLRDFFHRAQSSLKDLLFAHSGRIDDVQEKVDRWLADIPIENKPKEIIGITIVRKQKGRARGRIENTFLPIAVRLNVETGRCEMCCAYEKANSLAISPWSIFSDAIGFIAHVSPVKLADKREVQKTRFMDFVRQIISNSVEEEAQPLILIDSSNCVQLWGWLADVRMNAEQIDLGQQHQWMQQEWQGARLIRVRQSLAPKVIEKTERQLVETTLEDNRPKAKLKGLAPDLVLPYATKSTKLFRLTEANKTGCATYLSIGDKRLHDYLRGQSCYRTTEISTIVKNPENKEKLVNVGGQAVYQLSKVPPSTDYWPTPNPLEIVVTLRQPSDDPDQLAALVESLRYSFGHYSDWSILPAPLFFERVVRDYISEFAIEEDEDAETEQEQ